MLSLLNLGMAEIVLVLVVAVLVFGRDLPSAAVKAAATLQKLRRSLADLRRETGIDEELRRARRELEQAVPRDAGPVGAPRIVEQKPAPKRPPPASDAGSASGDQG